MNLIAFLTLLHILVLVYWLGGDLGAFYGSNFLIDTNRSTAERLMALKILNNIDMAPRSALILALPTGLALAWIKGWLTLPPWLPALVAAACLGWLVLAWAVHLRHGDSVVPRRIDIAIRWIVLSALLGLGIAGLLKMIPVPLFIAGKLIVLGTCIGMGLLVRRQLAPLFPAVREMTANGATPATDFAIASVMARTRPVVVCLWLLLLLAAYLGVATPA